MFSGSTATPRQPMMRRDRDAAARVVAGRRPDGAVRGGVELAGDDARREAGVRGQHLVRADHREAVAEREHDRASTPVSSGGSTRWPGTVDRLAGRGPLNQWTRKRFAASGSSGRLRASRVATDAGASVGRRAARTSGGRCPRLEIARPPDRERCDRRLRSRDRRRVIGRCGGLVDQQRRVGAGHASPGMLMSRATSRSPSRAFRLPAARNITYRARFTAGTVRVIRTVPPVGLRDRRRQRRARG